MIVLMCFFPITIFLVFFMITIFLVFLFLFWLSWFYVSLSCHGALVFLGDCGLGVLLHYHGFGLSLNCRDFVFFLIVMVLVCFFICYGIVFI